MLQPGSSYKVRHYCIHSAASFPFILQTELETGKANQKNNVCMCTLGPACVYICSHAFVYSGKSGVWILSGCLSDRKASSVKQRGCSISQRYASFRLLCIFPQTLQHTYNYEHRGRVHSHKQCWLVYIPSHQTHSHFTFQTNQACLCFFTFSQSGVASSCKKHFHYELKHLTLRDEIMIISDFQIS